LVLEFGGQASILELDKHQRDCQMDENVADLKPRKGGGFGLREARNTHCTWLQKELNANWTALAQNKEGLIRWKRVGSDYEMQTVGAEMMWIGKGALQA
jgi:hypothetical protein